MYPLTFSQVASYLGLESSDMTRITQVIIDSRVAKVGSLFFALPGSKTDGHKFVPQVLEQGGFAIVKKGYGAHQGILEVDNPLLALQQLAQGHLKQIGLPVVAVTGSNGKTTTKDLVAQVLSKKFSVHKTEDNFNNEIGLPLTIMGLKQEHQIVVLEMGMRGLGEIQALTKIAPPNIGVITNVGPAHLELLGSLENIAEAKTELLHSLPPEGLGILNGDDCLLGKHSYKAPKVLFFGAGKHNQLRASHIQVDQEGIASFVCHWQEEQALVRLAVPGKHNVYNSLAAIAVGLEYGISLTECIASLKQANVTKMRLEVKRSISGIKIIDDAYNASPASMGVALDTLKSIEDGRRKVAVLGDMFELGEFSEAAHFELGKSASKVCDLLFCVGSYASIVKKGAEAGGLAADQIVTYTTVAELLSVLDDYVCKDDLVLVKASRGMALEQVIDVLLER